MSMPLPSRCPDWAKLEWTVSQLLRTESSNQPLDIPDAPNAAGLYKMTWHGTEGWRTVRKEITVKATVRVQTPILDYSSLRPPLVLTVGRTTAIRKRIRQHFGTNPHNNRALVRFRQLLPDLQLDDLLGILIRNVRVEWVRIDSWVDRCILEKAGVVSELPIFDLDAEH